MPQNNATADIGFLPADVQKYHDEGFLILRNLFSEDEVRAMQSAADELAKSVGPIVRENPRLQVDKTSDGIRIRQVWPLIDISPTFNAIASHPRVIALMTALFGEAPEIFEDKLNYKYPRGGTAFAMHQDYAYWEGYSKRLSTLLIFLDESTDENGCLECVAGLHNEGMIPHQRLNGPKEDLVMARPDRPTAKVKGPAGTAAVFTCWTPHASGPNLSSKPRRALIFTYNPESDGSAYQANTGRVLADASEWLKQQHAESRI